MTREELLVRAGAEAFRRGWSDFDVVAPIDLAVLPPRGKPLLVIAESIDVNAAQTIAGLIGVGREVAVVSDRVEHDAIPWLPAIAIADSPGPSDVREAVDDESETRHAVLPSVDDPAPPGDSNVMGADLKSWFSGILTLSVVDLAAFEEPDVAREARARRPWTGSAFDVADRNGFLDMMGLDGSPYMYALRLVGGPNQICISIWAAENGVDPRYGDPDGAFWHFRVYPTAAGGQRDASELPTMDAQVVRALENRGLVRQFDGAWGLTAQAGQRARVIELLDDIGTELGFWNGADHLTMWIRGEDEEGYSMFLGHPDEEESIALQYAAYVSLLEPPDTRVQVVPIKHDYDTGEPSVPVPPLSDVARLRRAFQDIVDPGGYAGEYYRNDRDELFEAALGRDYDDDEFPSEALRWPFDLAVPRSQIGAPGCDGSLGEFRTALMWRGNPERICAAFRANGLVATWDGDPDSYIYVYSSKQ